MENVKVWTLLLPSQAFPVCARITLTQCYVIADYNSVVKWTAEDCTTCMSFLAWCLINWAQSTFTFDRVTPSPNRNCFVRFEVLKALFLRIHTFWNVVLRHWVSDILLGLLNMRMKEWHCHNPEDLDLHKLQCHITLHKSHLPTLTQLSRWVESIQQ
jgi:hypothetical protein